VQFGRGDLGALDLRLGGNLAADDLLHTRPVAIERGREIVAWGQRPVIAAPGRAFCVPANVVRAILQAFEERLPFAIYRSRVFLVAGVNVVDVGGVCALQKRGKGKGGVRVLARHDGFPVIFYYCA